MTDLPTDRYIMEAMKRVKVNPFTTAKDIKDNCNSHRSLLELARMIEKYEPTPKPVDPDLLIAREACAADGSWSDCGRLFLEGTHDEGTYVRIARRAIKLAREKGAL